MSPKTKNQFDQIRKESKAKILDAALKLFGTQGYQNTSISEIMKLAGVSKGLMYHYFSNKEELIKQLLYDFSAASEALFFSDTEGPPEAVLRNLFTSFFKTLRNDFEYWTLICNLGMQLDKFDFARDLAKDEMQKTRVFIEKLLTDLGWSDPGAEAKILVALFDGISIQYLWFNKDYYLDELENILTNKYCKQ
jgi:AcrR family transcriptional regulator